MRADQPSYYHLHVHFVHTAMDPTLGMVLGKAHLIDTVIDNIDLLPEYYKRAKLPCVFGQNDKLLAAIKASSASPPSESLKRPLP